MDKMRRWEGLIRRCPVARGGAQWPELNQIEGISNCVSLRPTVTKSNRRKDCNMKEKKEANVEVQHTSKPCGFCGCPPGDEAQWEAAADAAEMVFQQHYERLVLDRLLIRQGIGAGSARRPMPRLV